MTSHTNHLTLQKNGRRTDWPRGVVLLYTNVLPGSATMSHIRMTATEPERGDAIVVTSHHGEMSLTCSNEALLVSVVAYIVRRRYAPLLGEQARGAAQARKDCVSRPLRRLELSKRLASLSSDQGKPEGIVEFLRALYLSFG